MNLYGQLTHNKELTLTEINDMQPWEFDAFVDILIGIKKQKQKKTNGGDTTWHNELTEDQI